MPIFSPITVRIIRSYANFFPNTADDLPILGKVDGVEGFIMASGHCGHGIGMGPGSGKLIQELICDDKTTIPLDELNIQQLIVFQCGSKNNQYSSIPFSHYSNRTTCRLSTGCERSEQLDEGGRRDGCGSSRTGSSAKGKRSNYHAE
jgi:hypothetical protein